CKDLLAIFAGRLQEDSVFADTCARDDAWRNAIDELLKPLIKKLCSEATQNDWAEITKSIDNILARGVRIPPAPCAHVYFLAGRFSEAAKLWEGAGTTTSSDYQKAKAAIEPYPQRILSLSRLKLSAEIVSAYRDNAQIALTLDQTNAVTEALYEGGFLEEALNLAWRAILPSAAIRLSANTIRQGRNPLATQSLHMALHMLVQAQQWEPLANFASSLEFLPEKEWNDKALKDFVEAEVEALQFTLVRSLARSEGLPNVQTHIQRQVSDFLRRLIGVKGTRWQGKIRVEEAGAAFERAGRFTDAVSFYETIKKEPFSFAEKEFARRRWLACKRRQMDYERGLNAKVKADEIRKEINREIELLGIKSPDEIEIFPLLRPLTSNNIIPKETATIAPPSAHELMNEVPGITDSPPALPEPVKFQVGPYEVVASRKKRRCNITNNETMGTAYIKMDEKTCGGEVTFKRINDYCFDCNAWDLLVRFSGSSHSDLEMIFKALGITIIIQR
ncbi:MAG: hypothetical protein ACKVX9_12810, partial [Blastocatellia bacterium]